MFLVDTATSKGSSGVVTDGKRAATGPADLKLSGSRHVGRVRVVVAPPVRATNGEHGGGPSSARAGALGHAQVKGAKSRCSLLIRPLSVLGSKGAR